MPANIKSESKAAADHSSTFHNRIAIHGRASSLYTYEVPHKGTLRARHQNQEVAASELVFDVPLRLITTPWTCSLPIVCFFKLTAGISAHCGLLEGVVVQSGPICLVLGHGSGPCCTRSPSSCGALSLEELVGPVILYSRTATELEGSACFTKAPENTGWSCLHVDGFL